MPLREDQAQAVPVGFHADRITSIFIAPLFCNKPKDLKSIRLRHDSGHSFFPAVLAQGFRFVPAAAGCFPDLLSGSDQLRTMIEAGETAEAIKASWQDDIAAFKVQRKPYLLYDE